jgi:hypothetical protein
VIDQVLVAERDAENALAQKMDERVLDMIGTAVVDEATRQPFGLSARTGARRIHGRGKT